jgi:DNA-binding CsgD family transcriptional regulator
VQAAVRLLEHDWSARALDSSAGAHLLLARGRARLAGGRRDAALEDLHAAGRAVIVDNPAHLPWRSTLALALADSDPQAAAILADDELQMARRLGQRRGMGVALLACGLLCGGLEGIAHLEAVVTALRDSPAVLELARALCALGAARRRCGQRAAARPPLREALALAQRCGARLLARRAREELLASGARLRRTRLSGPESLTPAELRIARLAAGGLTNRQIAQALVLSIKTVGTHLGHIYRKLDLSGPRARELLAAALWEQAARPDGPASAS